MKINYDYSKGGWICAILLLLTLLPAPVAATAGNSNAKARNVQQQSAVSGTVVDEYGEPLIGVTVIEKGTQNGTITDIDGNYSLVLTMRNPTLVFSFVGYQTVEESVGSRSTVSIQMKEEQNTLQEVVVTAMGILKKESSLTYATQQIKSDDFMKVQEQNIANSLEGKVSGVVITPSAGGAGGASKIVLRGNKSILGNSQPLIVVDGIPMSNDTRGRMDMNSGANLTYSSSSEGSDPLSMINADDIESINVLKGANAAALYGSVAANGVIMITTKKGREGKLDINLTSNITFDTPLLTPKIQNTYGADVNAAGGLSVNSWGSRIADRASDQLVINVPNDQTKFGGGTREVYLRNHGNDDIDDFYRTGVTTNNSLSLSGGTEKIKTYFSFANSHANGMVKENSYNRNTLAFRQSYNLWKRLNIDVAMNYYQTTTRNRQGGGTVLNPIYHLYMVPRNIDMGYYSSNYRGEGQWMSEEQSLYRLNGAGGYDLENERVALQGPMQLWPYMAAMQNNPYWLLRQNRSTQKNDRITGSVNAKLDIYDGLSFQYRLSFDHDKFDGDSRRYATTFNPAGMEDYGRYWKDLFKTNEIYIDYLLSYNKVLGDDEWNLSATAGYVEHRITGTQQRTDVVATYIDPMHQVLSDRINMFQTNAGGAGATSTTKVSNWDKAYLLTAQVGWRDMVYVDGSYRRDWYRPYKQFKDRGTADNYGYFGVGANAILSSMMKMPEWINYMKYRISYSQVGNSIPNVVYSRGSENLRTGAITPNQFAQFKNPVPETTNSFETGLEMLFFNNRLNFDFTYYNTTIKDLYMIASNASGKSEPVNSGKVRNSGFEASVGYNFRLAKDFNWKSTVNVSYNDNKILETTYNEDGSEKLIYQDVAGVRVRYRKGGSIGDMYITDFKRNDDGTFALNEQGKPQLESEANKQYNVKIGNMNSKWQLGWSNTFNYKDFQLFFLINGRFGGKVISLTEAYLDNMGVSARSGAAREYAEKNGLYVDGKPAMYLPDGSDRLIAVQDWYEFVGGTPVPGEYVYSATNFRLRELSMGYTFRNLVGAGKHLNVSFIARNLFFFYKDSPADPDVALSTTNGLSAFELFNMPSARSFGFSLKLNF